MMKFLKSTVAKTTLGLLVSAFVVFGVAAPKAQAITQAEATAIITALGLSGSQAAVIQALVSGGSSTTASYDFGSATLRVGSSGQYVQNLQMFLNGAIGAGLATDGAFGPMTKAKVAAWQAANGLVADGLFGPNSMAKAASMGGVTTPTVPGTPVTSGNLQGGAGSVVVSELSTPSSSTKVGQGDNNVKVLGIEIEADNNSDIAITSMRVQLEHTSGAGSDKLNRYADSVSIWMENTKIGEADVDEFSESAGKYSKSINLSNAVIKADKTVKFYVAVDAISNLDSGNEGSSNNTWTATLLSTRYQDATGAILTDQAASIDNTHVYDSLSNTNDVELKVALANGTRTSETIKVSTTSDTNQVELMKFTLRAQGSDMYIDQIPVLFTTSETDLDEVTSNVTLKIDGGTFNESVVTSSSATATINFDDLGINLDEGDTITGTIYADILDIETGTFDEGTTLKAEITSGLATTVGSGAGALDVEDENGDQLVTGDRSGAAIGNIMTFRSTGVNVVMGTPSYNRTTDTNGLVTSVEYTIPVAVTSFGNTLYMGQSAQLATAATASNAFALVVETANAPTVESTSATTSITLSTSNAQIESNGYRLDDGQTKNFTIKVNLLAGVDNQSHRFRIDTARTFTEAGLVTGTNSDLLPVESYRTGFEFLNN